ncbi:glycosyltransferase family 2 protein [Bacillus wiedmannii]|uniref:glycosyltransferase family 2 protein n=1 Tax=Bacillus wiedmannii TaxID=1890302 RepID=UPI0007DB0B47|nr:glycosyltransferase [Bacillus wiedmannii]OAK13407.1 glycosyl transferase [Bacillus wiedmannii]OAK17778.1 glycosyl transferase [Bacillus wiedmannii]
MNPKISIIVPVYKVEQYIHKCIDSILKQTFKEFELILIDDGSPDSCGEICDGYATQDSRIKVIHKENGGLSSARNAGLEIAQGDYIGFVDSDDWIEVDMYELLYSMCVEQECDIAICSSEIHYNDKTVISSSQPFVIHDRYSAMRAMLEGDLYDEVVWTKLFKRQLLEGIKFPVGMSYEDTAFTYKVIHKCNKVCFIGEPKYHYIKRDNSMMDQAVKEIKIDSVLIYDEMCKFMERYYKELYNLVILKLGNCSMLVLNLISLSGRLNEHKSKYYKVIGILNRYFYKTMRLKEYGKSVKFLLLATKLHPLLYKFLINNFAKRG